MTWFRPFADDGSPDPSADRLAFVLNYAIALAAALAIDTVNVLTLLNDAADRGQVLDWRRTAINEYSSGLVTLALTGFVWIMATRVPPRRARWPLRLVAHVAGSVAFAAAHVAGLILVRRLAFAAAGLRYGYGGFAELVYEWRKDLLVYAAGIGLVTLLRAAIRTRQPPPRIGLPDGLLEFRDGRRVVRAPASRLVAARAQGNYVEMILSDGRRPLVRSTLSAMMPQLAAHGLVRVHRSWVVNPAQVRQIDPLAGGNRRLTLEGGLIADCSRRYAQALADPALIGLNRSSR
jgi:hypothetical protein